MTATKNHPVKNREKHNPSDPSKKTSKRPENAPSGQEDERYPREAESGSPIEGTDQNFSESHDVTPPNKKEFPSVGPAKTDFESRPQGRTTGRMIGHEPGTEGV